MAVQTALLFLLSALVFAPERPDLSGTWKLDGSRSEFGRLPAPTSMVRKIEHNEPKIHIFTTQSGAQGEITTTLDYRTDGKESVNTVRGAEVRSLAQWEGSELGVRYKRMLRDTELSFEERWSLSADRKVLTVTLRISAPQGETTMKMVFDKQ